MFISKKWIIDVITRMTAAKDRFRVFFISSTTSKISY